MLRTLALLVAGAIVLACAITPPVYGWLLAVDPDIPWPFSRVFDRVAMLCAVVLLIVLRRQIGLDRVRRCFAAEDWPAKARGACFGFTLSAFAALLVLPLIAASPQLRWTNVAAELLLLKLLEAVLAGLLVSAIEESFFRVMVFGALRRRVHVAVAAALASLFYALLHFLSPVGGFEYAGGSPWQGFLYFGKVLERYADPAILPGVFGLFLVGLVLCLAIHRTGSLSLCVGLHAGWFVVAKLAVYAIGVAEGGRLPSGVNKRYFLVGQPWTWLSILLVGVVIYSTVAWFRTPATTPEPKSG